MCLFGNIPFFPKRSSKTTSSSAVGTSSQELNAFSPHTQDYITQQERVEKPSERFARIDDDILTDAEKRELNEYIDPISQEIIDVALLLNDRHYDRTSIENLIKHSKSIDPITQRKFYKRDAQADRAFMSKIENFLTRLEEKYLCTADFQATFKP